MRSQALAATPLQKPAPLIFAAVWLAFTSVHATLMLGGIWSSGSRSALFFLVPLYLLFFGAGFWMMRSWWRWRALTRLYGLATLEQASDLMPGQTTQFTVQFDRPWGTDLITAHGLEAQLQWPRFDSDGDPVGELHTIPASAQVQPMADHTQLRIATPLPLQLPQAAARSHQAMVVVRAGSDQGWRFALPLEAFTRFDSQQGAPEAPSPEEIAHGKKVLGIVVAVAALGAVGLAVHTFSSDSISLFKLGFSLVIGYVAYIMWTLRAQIGTHLQTDAAAVAAMRRRWTRSGTVIAVIMFGAFAADFIAPIVFKQSLGEKLAQQLAPALGNKRPAQPVRFALPRRIFDSQTMAMDVQTQGQAVLSGNTLIFTLDSLKVIELLNQPDSNRLKEGRIGLAWIKDEGSYVSSVSNEVALTYSNPQRARSITLAPGAIEFTLEPRADLAKIWLRLHLYTDKGGYAPIDATPGHLAQAVAAADPVFSLCSGHMSIRSAIKQHCNDRLASALAAPHLRLWESMASWRRQEPLSFAAYNAGNAGAIPVLKNAGIDIEATDEKQRTVLMMAAWNNREDFVDALLAAGANAALMSHTQKHSALTGALYDHTLDAARKLIKNPADLEEHLKRWQYRAEHRVAMDGQIETLRLLLDLGVSPNSVNVGASGRGETLLMAAARSKTNSVAMMAMLLERGAQLNNLDAHGKNATDWAEFFGNAQASDFLCARGLEPTALDPAGQNNEKRKRASCSVPSAVTS